MSPGAPLRGWRGWVHRLRRRMELEGSADDVAARMLVRTVELVWHNRRWFQRMHPEIAALVLDYERLTRLRAEHGDREASKLVAWFVALEAASGRRRHVDPPEAAER